MRVMRASIAVSILIAAAGAAPAQRTTVASLAWLSGAWVEEKGREWTEESWSPPRGGVMLGTGLSGRGGAARDYEYMRIAAGADGAIAFWGSPRGRPAVAFPLVSASANQVAFENPSHDFPTRISYRRSGDFLTATISGPSGRGALSWHYRRR